METTPGFEAMHSRWAKESQERDARNAEAFRRDTNEMTADSLGD